MPMYKTKLCQKFMQTGQCNRGEECSFAHGYGELRQPPPGAPRGPAGPGGPAQDMPSMGPGPGPGPMGMNPVCLPDFVHLGGPCKQDSAHTACLGCRFISIRKLTQVMSQQWMSILYLS